MPFPPIPLTVPVMVVQVATEYHLPPPLVWAVVWRESQNTHRHVTPNDGGAGWPSLGLMQVNLGTVRAMGGRWQAITPEEDLLDPRTNLEAGCEILRWRLYQVLRQRGIAVPWRGGRPDYAWIAQLLGAMVPEAQRAIYEHAVAVYTCGDVALRGWPALEQVMAADKARTKAGYVRDVIGFWDELTTVPPRSDALHV